MHIDLSIRSVNKQLDIYLQTREINGMKPPFQKSVSMSYGESIIVVSGMFFIFTRLVTR